ncbi:MAG: hypothetical protein ABIL47_07035, partial [candidate division WOR-3 bacterium]
LSVNYNVGHTPGLHTLPAKTVLGHLLSLNIEPSVWPSGMFFSNPTRFMYNQTLVNDAPESLFTPIGSGAVLQVTTYLSTQFSNPSHIPLNHPQIYKQSSIG